MTQKSERRVIAGDYKRIYLDLPNWELLAPVEGIYDEPTVYYKANLRWAKLIEGFLSHLTEITAWKEAEDENYHGTQQIIRFLERVDVPFVFPEEGGCNNFLPSAAFVEYYPQDPYNQPDYVPDDYLVPPFFVNDELEYPALMGYLATDVFIAPAAINIDPIDLVTLNLPRIEITVKGAGQLEIDFLAVQAGSSAILKIGSMPNIIDIITGGIIEEGVRIIDLNNDSISIPPESDIVISEEVNIEAEPDELTTVFIVFMPVIDDSFIPLALGGGIRQIGLCAFEGMEENTGVEDVRFNVETCTFEKRVLGEWQMIEGGDQWMICIPESGEIMTWQDYRDGIVAAAEIIGLRVGSGEIVPFAVDSDGEVTVGAGEDGTGTPIEDDPLTEIDEPAASRMGGMLEVAAQLEKVLDKIDAYFGVPSGAVTPVTTEADAVDQMQLYFICDPIPMEAAVQAYYAWRLGGATQIGFNRGTSLPYFLYCNGFSYDVLGRFIIDSSGYIVSKQKIVLNFWNALGDEFFSQAYAKGATVYSTTYKETSCYPSPTEVMNLVLLGTTYITQTLWKLNHRILVTFENYFTDNLGNVKDGFWYDAAGATLPVNHIAAMTISSGSGVTKPTINQVPYNSAHKYQFTLDITSGPADLRLMIPSTSMTAPITPSVAGVGIKATIEDLGEIA